MSTDWVDISVTLHDGMPHWPGDAPFKRTMTLEIARGGAANVSEIEGSAHTGTHMDGPSHFIEGAASLDTLPLTATVGPARVIEVHDPEAIRISEIEPYRLARGERVLFKTRNSSRVWQNEPFNEHFVFIPPDTAEYLAAAGVQTVGVDYLSVGGFHSDGAATHRALLGAGIWIIEGLNLAGVEPGEYELVCLPVKIQDSDGAPARAILRRVAG